MHNACIRIVNQNEIYFEESKIPISDTFTFEMQK